MKTTACLAASLMLATLAITATAQAQNASSASSASMGMSSHSDAKLAHTDTAFLKQAAENGHAEVEGSKLALSKSSDAKVKAFAEKMVADHTKAGDELTALAASKGVKVSDEPSMAQKAKLKILSMRDGASFDKHYAETIGVKAHQDTVKLFQKAADEAKDPEVKAFATKTLPTLQHHLEMARDLYANVNHADKKMK